MHRSQALICRKSRSLIKPTGLWPPKEKQMKNIKLTERAEAALDFLTALVIGVGLAALIAAWWSA